MILAFLPAFLAAIGLVAILVVLVTIISRVNNDE